MSAERLAAAFASLLLATTASADVFLAGDIWLATGDQQGTYELSARLPPGIADGRSLGWPADCVQTGYRRSAIRDGELVSYQAVCTRPPGRADAVATRWPLDAARLQSELSDVSGTRTLLPEGGGIRIPFDAIPARDRGWRQIAPEMLRQGLLHIWLGWDHLTFVLCLCMLARGLRLLGLVTAFTVGHSLSMGLAFFDLLRVPVPPTEAVIALSIVLVAREALLAGAGTPGSRPIARTSAIVTGFGLVHGLGFANALGELGISDDERWPALAFFNLGVEMGQIAFVAAVVGIVALLRRVALDAAAKRLALHASGIVGGFWLVERVAGF